MQKKLIYFLTIVATVTIAFLINSCQQSPITPTERLMTDAGNGCDSPNVFCDTGKIKIQNPCPGDVNTIDLWAGNPPNSEYVGYVVFTFVSGSTYNVTYHFTNPDFEAENIHFAIECSLADIPQTNKKNPKPGQFQYSYNGPFGSSYNFDVTLPAGCTCFYVAAHAGGTIGGLQCFNTSIPAGCITLSNVHHPEPPIPAYWSFDISNAGSFNGTYLGWCIDLGTEMQINTTFECARIYSSLEPIPCAVVEQPENFDKVNYLLNHWHVGDEIVLKNSDCSTAGGTYVINAVDIQKAIWTLLDEGPGNIWSQYSNPLAVNALVCDADANGDGFIPSCANGDMIAFVVIPDGCPFTVQPILAMAPCCNAQGVTAWGDGLYGAQFGGSSWATYFKWCPTCE